MSQLVALAERVRAGGTLGRSDLMNRLFDYLLETSLASRSPKEVEVAQEVFGKDSAFDMAQDASVRVYIHRLRKKLDEIDLDPSGQRLTVPRGEYRLAIERPDAVSAVIGVDDDAPDPAGPDGAQPRRTSLMIAALAFALLIGALLGGSASTLWSRTAGADPLASTGFWRPIVGTKIPTLIALGDYYIFGEAPDTMQVTRLVREFSINSRDDLDQYLMNNPDSYGRYVDVDLHYLPVSAGPALRDLLPTLNAFTSAAASGPPRVTTTSRLTPENLKRANIVYVGLLSSLGLLRDPLFEASGFRIGASYDELIDSASGKQYTSDLGSGSTAGSRKPRRDYAYLASFPGPTGNHMMIVSGTRDPAVMQAAELASDKAQLDQIAARAGNGEGFEALYEVWSVDRLNVGSKLVVARPLKKGDLWRSGRVQDIFPDELTAAGSTPTGAAGIPGEPPAGPAAK